MTNQAGTPTPYGESIGLEMAKRVLEAAEEEARAQGWPMVIAVVDCGGHLVAFHRMDQAQYGSIEVAQAKARTAAMFRRPTSVFQEALAAGGIGLRMLSLPGACAVEGGVPLLRDGAVIGGIGVSGMQSHQDAQVALAGLRVLER